MTDGLTSLIVLILAALGVAAAIAAFMRTPRALRFRGAPRKSLAEQLKDLPESAHAVIVKGNRKRALIKSALYILIGIALVGFSIWSKNTTNPECVSWLGFNVAYIWLVLFCYGLPIGFFVASFLFLRTGLKTIKTGYFPPLDATVFSDTIAKKGTVSQLRGVVLLALPIFTLFIIYLGNNAYTAIAAGKNMQEIVEKLEAKCQ